MLVFPVTSTCPQIKLILFSAAVYRVLQLFDLGLHVCLKGTKWVIVLKVQNRKLILGSGFAQRKVQKSTLKKGTVSRALP